MASPLESDIGGQRGNGVKCHPLSASPTSTILSVQTQPASRLLGYGLGVLSRNLGKVIPHESPSADFPRFSCLFGKCPHPTPSPFRGAQRRVLCPPCVAANFEEVLNPTPTALRMATRRVLPSPRVPSNPGAEMGGGWRRHLRGPRGRVPGLDAELGAREGPPDCAGVTHRFLGVARTAPVAPAAAEAMRRPWFGPCQLLRTAGPRADASFSLPGAARSAAAAASPAPRAQVLESPGGRSVSAWGGKKNTHFFKFQTSDGRGGELTASPLRRGGVTQAAPSPRPGARAPAQVSPGAQSRYRRALAPSARSRRGGFPCEDAHIPGEETEARGEIQQLTNDSRLPSGRAEVSTRDGTDPEPARLSFHPA